MQQNILLYRSMITLKLDFFCCLNQTTRKSCLQQEMSGWIQTTMQQNTTSRKHGDVLRI
jgi:hypothetical protein